MESSSKKQEPKKVTKKEDKVGLVENEAPVRQSKINTAVKFFIGLNALLCVVLLILMIVLLVYKSNHTYMSKEDFIEKMVKSVNLVRNCH